MNQKGRHVLADVYLSDWPGDDAVLQACEAAIEAARMTIVSQSMKRFQPVGVTSVWLLAESHFAVHTYPEHAYLSVDCYTCGDEGRPEDAVRSLLARFPVKNADVMERTRGSVPGASPRPNTQRSKTLTWQIWS